MTGFWVSASLLTTVLVILASAGTVGILDLLAVLANWGACQ